MQKDRIGMIHVHRKTDRRADRHTYKHTCIDRPIYLQTDTQTCLQTGRQA